MNKCDDCIQKITKPESCQQCAEHYQTKYMSAAPQFCPYCGYDHLVIHQDGTATCAKCQNTFSVKARSDHRYLDECWYDIPGYEEYQVSNFLRIFSKERSGYDRRTIPGRILSVYRKNNELYISLTQDGRNKEFNVKNLYREAVREERKPFS